MAGKDHNLDERFEFTSKTRKNLGILLVAGIVVTIIGIILAMNSGHGEAGDGHALKEGAENLIASVSVDAMPADEGSAEHHGSPTWLKRLYVSLWQNNVFFAGLGLIGVVFLAIQYASQAGWSAGFGRPGSSF